MTIKTAFNRVRRELREVGLLDGLLDDIELRVSHVPSWLMLARGWFFDGSPTLLLRLIGWREGIIYLPKNLEGCKDLTSVIRHEFAHAWAWKNPDFFEKPWFQKIFGRYYGGTKRRLPVRHFEASRWYGTHISLYATTHPSEDWAETFETWMRWRKSLWRFADRPVLYRKLETIETAVKTQKKKLN